MNQTPPPNATPAYVAGFEARQQGKTLLNCPHTLDTTDGQEWVDGWEARDQQMLTNFLAPLMDESNGPVPELIEHPKRNTGADVQRIMAAGSDNPPRKPGTTPLHVEAGKIVQRHITHATATPEYSAGFEARKAGKNLWDNPHATTSQAHAEWKRGWETAHHLGSARRETPAPHGLPHSKEAIDLLKTMQPIRLPEPIERALARADAHSLTPPSELEKLGTWENVGNVPKEEPPTTATPACPFCDSDRTGTVHGYHVSLTTSGFSSFCADCGAAGPVRVLATDAMKAWAALTPPPAPSARKSPWCGDWKPPGAVFDTDQMNKAITPPCPFCASDDTRVATSFLPIVSLLPNAYRCVCLACYCQGPRDKTMEGAIAAWKGYSATGQTPPAFILRMEHELDANVPQKGPWQAWEPTGVQAMQELTHHCTKLAVALDTLDKEASPMLDQYDQQVQRYHVSQRAAELAADIGNIAAKIWQHFGNAPLPGTDTDPNKAPA